MKIFIKLSLFIVLFVALNYLREIYLFNADIRKSDSIISFHFAKSIWRIFSFVFVTLIVYVGILFFKYKIAFYIVFDIVLSAGFVFLLHYIFLFLWFGILKTDFSIEELENFYPFSVYNIIPTNNIPLQYFLKELNLFEIAFWLIIAFFLKKKLNNPYQQSFEVVFVSYGITFLFLGILSVLIKNVLFP